MSYTINNPGGGDCGFYAFAIGLIEIIQQEYKLEGSSNTFERWKKEGLDNISLQNILDINLYNLYHFPNNYQKNLLFVLQMSLRKIAVNVSKIDLLNQIQKEKLLNDKRTLIEGTTVYGKFMELVQYFLTENPPLQKISQFNELALSPEILNLAEKTANSLQEKLINRPFENIEKIQNAYVKEVLLQDVMHDDELNPHSVILKGTDKIMEAGRWATHSDLKEIAAQLHVNLFVVSKENGVLTPNYSTITLNNENNAHWTTQVEQLPEPHRNFVEETIVPEKNQISSEQILTLDSNTLEKTQYVAKKDSEIITKDQTFSIKEEQVIAATVSSQVQENKVDLYRENIRDLVHASSTLGLFAQVKNKIDVNLIDTAKAAIDEKGVTESDESFAARLQEAEFRRVKLK